MSHEITYHLTRDGEEIELTIEYAVAAYCPAQTYGPPEDCSPAEGGEIEEMTVRRDGRPFTLTSLEEREVEDWIYDNHDYSED